MGFKSNVKKFVNRLRGEVGLETYIKNGLKVGKNFSCMKGCGFDYSHSFLISIGDDVTFSTNVKVLAHDASTKRILGYTKIGIVEIGNNVFVGENAIILPGVKIGDNVILGAGSVVPKSLNSNGVYAGNPAKFICSFDDYIERQKSLMNENNVFDESWTMRGNITEEKKEKMRAELRKGIGFVK